MGKSELIGIQRLPRKVPEQGRCGGPLAAVGRVADQRMPGMSQVDADLVGASSVEATIEEAGDRLHDPRLQPVARSRRFASGLDHGHLLPVPGGAGDVTRDRADRRAGKGDHRFGWIGGEGRELDEFLDREKVADVREIIGTLKL